MTSSVFAERAHTRKINHLQTDVLINPQKRSLVNNLVATVKGYHLWSTLVSVCEILHVRVYNCFITGECITCLCLFETGKFHDSLLIKCIIDKTIS